MADKEKEERTSYTYNNLSLTLEGERYAAVKAFATENKLKQKELIQSMIDLVIGEASEEDLNRWTARTKAMEDFKLMLAAQQREAGRQAAAQARMRDKQKALEDAKAAAIALGMSEDLLESL